MCINSIFPQLAGGDGGWWVLQVFNAIAFVALQYMIFHFSGMGSWLWRVGLDGKNKLMIIMYIY